MKKFVKDFFIGMRYTLAGFDALFRTPSLWHYALLPWLIGLILYTGLAATVITIVLPWLGDLIRTSPEAASWWSWTVAVLRWLAMLSAGLLALAFFVFTYFWFSMLLALPFIDELAAKYEQRAYGISFKASAGYFLTSLFNSARINLKGVLWTVLLLPILIFVPGGFLICAPLLGYYMALSCVLYGAEHRRIPYSEFLRQTASARGAICGMGTLNYLGMCLIPFAAILLLPVIAIAAIKLYNEVILNAPAQKTPDRSDTSDGFERDDPSL